MKCTVFYDSWQMECCGTPFSVGDIVKWLVLKAEQLNTPVNVGAINYCYEAHSSDWQNIFVLEGKVATVYKGNIIKNLIMDCQSYTKYRPNETTGGIFVSWRRKEELPTGA